MGLAKEVSIGGCSSEDLPTLKSVMQLNRSRVSASKQVSCVPGGPLLTSIYKEIKVVEREKEPITDVSSVLNSAGRPHAFCSARRWLQQHALPRVGSN